VHPGEHSFDSDYYNPDGSHGMLCGNGARCAVRFALDHGTTATNNQVPFRLNGREYTATIPAEPEPPAIISIRLPAPTQAQMYMTGSLRGVSCDVYYVFVPSDHAVISMPERDMRNVVRAIRHHELFPRGVNVNMVEVDDEGIVNIATFERGVEAVTGACGTGAVASAVALWRQGKVGEHVVLRPPSGRLLEVTIHHTSGTIESVDLKGDAQYDS
jgi:diaminopimelate epimerase